mgnify:CR=1 FL=1
MLVGSTRVSCISSGDWYARRRAKNDAHRFALLLTQLMSDKKQRGLMASCVNILCRNRHVCVRMPRFKVSSLLNTL